MARNTLTQAHANSHGYREGYVTMWNNLHAFGSINVTYISIERHHRIAVRPTNEIGSYNFPKIYHCIIWPAERTHQLSSI